MIDNTKIVLSNIEEDLSVYPQLGDATNMGFQNGYFDVVYANEMISHVRDLPSLFSEVHRVLKKGGVFYISDGNNALNPSVLRATMKMWKKRDCDPSFVESTKCETSEDDPDHYAEPYFFMRKRMIKQNFPDLEENEVNLLSNKTTGLYGKDLINACENYIRNRVLPKRPKLSWCRNPVSGEYCERMFNPFNLKKEIESFGFRANVFAHSGSRKPFRYFNPFFRLLTPLTIHISASFKIVAKKTKGVQ